jgi:hypothetical protein
MSRPQLDLFASEQEKDLFGENYAPPVYRPDPDRVRARLQKILAEARAAQSMPWERTTVCLYRTIFPQMSLSLPEEEAARLRLEFEAELVRLAA